jgi:hypothetical protein
LITNTEFAIADRNFPFITTYTNVNCRRVDSSKTGPCFALNLTGNVFINYNNLQFFSGDSSNKIEGMVIELNNFDGPITVYNNEFS